jgi:hypothetical protein
VKYRSQMLAFFAGLGTAMLLALAAGPDRIIQAGFRLAALETHYEYDGWPEGGARPTVAKPGR